MCGIAGCVSPDLEERPLIVRRMLAAVLHRGPDDEGLETKGDGTLGVRRLSIIDLAHGHQPMANESGEIIAVQNGEIYNFEALRADLIARGHVLKTRSDTEILPHAYEEWGGDLVPRLRGMFAIALWDSRTRTLLLARDRFGKKPLHYAWVGDSFVFGSEIQALLAVPGLSRELDREAIDDYLTFGYVPSPRSAFAAIRKVPPGHMLVLRDKSATVERYWRPAFTPKLQLSIDEAAEQVREKIDDAVKVRLMSDVPIGAFLSGGLDSSTVVAYMARHSAQPVKTFSIGFADQAFDELPYARLVAQRFGTDHHELVIDADQTDVLPMLVRHLGEPFADSSIVPTYHVSRITREHVTVALNGDGGDELFAGYDRYKAAAIARLTTERLPAPVVRGLARVAGVLPLASWMPRPVHRIRRFAVALGSTPEARHLRWTGYFTGELRDRVVGPALRSLGSGRAYRRLAAAAELSGATDPSEHYMASDILTYLPDDLLVKVDIASMACSLEARSPLLDHHLAELVLRLPPEYKLSPRTSKVLLRRAMRGIVPDEILDRRRKMGFSAPVGAWLRGPLRGLYGDAATASRAEDQGFIAPGAAAALYAEHASGKTDRTLQLWNVLMLELWLRECVRPNVALSRADGAADRAVSSLKPR